MRVTEERELAPGAGARQEANDAFTALADALRDAGIVLPSLWVESGPPIHGVVLIDLGRARPDVVMQLAGVIRSGAKR